MLCECVFFKIHSSCETHMHTWYSVMSYYYYLYQPHNAMRLSIVYLPTVRDNIQKSSPFLCSIIFLQLLCKNIYSTRPVYNSFTSWLIVIIWLADKKNAIFHRRRRNNIPTYENIIVVLAWNNWVSVAFRLCCCVVSVCVFVCMSMPPRWFVIVYFKRKSAATNNIININANKWKRPTIIPCSITIA